MVNWTLSKYGPDDEIGAANLLIPEITLAAVRLVKTGRSYSLAVPIDKNLPAFRHRSSR